MTETMAPTRAARRRTKSPWATMLIVALGLAGSIPLIRHLEDPPRAAFAVRNDTIWDLAVYVRTGHDSVMPVAMAPAERTREVREILVPGESWEFIWRFRGDDIGFTTVSHESLARTDFELLVPDDVGQALRDMGAPPSP